MTILGERITIGVLFLGVVMMMLTGCTTETKECLQPNTVITTTSSVCQCDCMTLTTSTSTVVF